MSSAQAVTAGAELLAERFASAAGERRAALMPYLMGGFPDDRSARMIAAAYADAGADVVEMGVPFSDPLADGPVIHAAATRALGEGATLGSVLNQCEALAARLPVVLMIYANMVLASGPEDFSRRAAEAGAAAAIVPDLPLEEAEAIRESFACAGLALVPLVAPTTPPERRRRICAHAEGFTYIVADVGVTGERSALPDELRPLIEAVKAERALPAAVGFGIGTPEQAARVGELADGVIIGSRLVRAAAEAGSAEEAVAEVSDFISKTRAALRG